MWYFRYIRKLVNFPCSLISHGSRVLSYVYALFPVFAKLFASQTLDDNKSCVSFAVVSLFTIVPTDLDIQVACQHFSKWPVPSRTHSLTTADIPNLLEFCLNATYFAFRYSLYQQVHGTAMSSLVSVVVADLVTSMWLGLQTVSPSSFHH